MTKRKLGTQEDAFFHFHSHLPYLKPLCKRGSSLLEESFYWFNLNHNYLCTFVHPIRISGIHRWVAFEGIQTVCIWMYKVSPSKAIAQWIPFTKLLEIWLTHMYIFKNIIMNFQLLYKTITLISNCIIRQLINQSLLQTKKIL